MRTVPSMALVTAMLAACGSEPAAEAPKQAAPTTAASATDDMAAPAPVEDAGSDAVEQPAAFAQCRTCHQVEPGKHGIGPSLAGVYGKQAARSGDFAYSAAMRGSGLTWDDATLDEYLKNPRKVVPGGKMAYAGLRDDAKRAELIAWLKTQ